MQVQKEIDTVPKFEVVQPALQALGCIITSISFAEKTIAVIKFAHSNFIGNYIGNYDRLLEL